MLSSNNKEQDDTICVGEGRGNGEIHLYKMDSKEQAKFTLLQKFPKEHVDQSITSLLELNQTTLVSSSSSYK
jgi:hypothetical protein